MSTWVVLAVLLASLSPTRVLMPEQAQASESPPTHLAGGARTVIVREQNAPLPTGRISLLIDTRRRTLTVMVDGRPYKSYPICVGKPQTPTPVGEWKVVHKSTSWGGGFGSRWLGLNVPWGIYGIHGTNKPWTIGRAESHGCVRMYNRDVEELYPWVKIGTPVKIVGWPEVPPDMPVRTLKRGAVGPDVVQVQLRLKDLGLYWADADGRYGGVTERAVKYWQLLRGLTVTGELTPEMRRMLQADVSRPPSAKRA